MKYTEATQGRVFVLRLENGEIVHEVIENFAKQNKIKVAYVSIIGGAAKESRLVVGPEDGDATPVVPTVHILDNVYEVTGTGTLFPDDQEEPMLHLHMACGRKSSTVTGCIRSGVKVWLIMEVVITELLGASGKRVMDSEIGFKLLKL